VFVGNLSYDVTREELIEIFGAAGKVVDAKVPTDRETGRPRGFAFVEFESDEGAAKSIELLNGQDMKGRPLRVNEADSRPPRPAGAGGPSFRPPSFRSDRPSFGRGAGGGGGELPFPPPDLREDRSKEGRRFKQKPVTRRPAPKRRGSGGGKGSDYDDYDD
jgi:RNA recognition motif-containing protein